MHINYNIFLQHYDEKMRVGLLVMRQQTLLQPMGEVQRAFIPRFNDVCNKRQAIKTLREMKQWKDETMEDYYDFFYNYMLLYHNS
jgi:hypothetical protein